MADPSPQRSEGLPPRLRRLVEGLGPAAYAAGLLLVDRLFVVVKPKLLTLPWFARLWRWSVAVRSKAVGLFRRSS
jgi:hypothetical protein